MNCSYFPWVGKYLTVLLIVPIIYSMYMLGVLVHTSSGYLEGALPVIPADHALVHFAEPSREHGNSYFG